MNKKISIVLILSMAAAMLFANDGAETQRWGLFIGANNGGRGLQRLRYADDDAQSLATTLTELGGIPASHSEILIDPNPQDVLDSLDQMAMDFAALDPSVKKEVIFYYSGHSDEEGMILGNEKLPYIEVKKRLEALNSEVTVAVLDSCSSGAFTRAKGGVHRAPFMLDDSVNTQGHAYLTSSSASEISQESDLIGGSFFTYFLIAGLRGAADNNSDGRITLNELYQHSYSETINRTLETGGVQHPTYEINLTGSGDLVMTDINEPSSVLILDRLLEGQFFIKNGQGALVLEMEKPLGQAFPLALPAGEYTVQVVQSTGVSRSAPVALAENSSFTLGPMDMAPVGLEETRSRGETAVDMTDDDSITIETSDGVIVISREGIQLIRDDLLGNSSITSNDISTMEEETESRDLSELPLNERNRIQRRYNDEVSFALTFVPGVGTYNVSNKVVNTELGFMAYAGALEGMQLGYLGAYTKDHSNGLQVGGIYSITRGSFSGLQASGTYGHIQGELEGAQLSGVVGITTGAINGAQFSGVLNLSRDNIDGIQVSGFGNFTRGSLEGAQIGGFINYVKEDLDGAQIAGFINIVEGDATGTQIGIINIGNSLDGMPIGLLNIYKEGITTLGAWTGVDDRAETYYSLMTGNDWFYNHFFMGGEGPEIWTDPNACVGFGIGLREELFKGIALDVDVNFKTQMYQDYEIDENNPAEQQWENYWTDSWGNQNTLLGRVVLTTTWGIQPYWGYTAEIQKSDLLDGEDLVYQFEEPDLEGYGIKFNMIMGIRVDLY